MNVDMRLFALGFAAIGAVIGIYVPLYVAIFVTIFAMVYLAYYLFIRSGGYIGEFLIQGGAIASLLVPMWVGFALTHLSFSVRT